jgi:adenylate kinase
MKTNNRPSSATVPKASDRPGDRAAWLNGGDAHCPAAPLLPKPPCRVVLLGAPGVGKGTQAELLHQWFGACHLSTGDIFRAAKNLPPGEQTPAMKSALDYMARGALAPDETVLALVSERVRCLRCIGGFLLDGFPRTVAQAEALQQLLKAEHLPLTAVIDYELPIDQIVERLAGRRVCSSCKAVFHLTGEQPVKETCLQCGGRLYQREDDRPEAIRVRMAAYHRSTEPLIEYYRQRDLLVTISAEGKPAEILQRTEEALASRPHIAH